MGEMRVYKISMAKGTCPFTEKTVSDAIAGIQSTVEEAEIGTEVTINVIEMTEKEYAELPEWTGP
jgi:isochorismate hydrolase